MYKNILLPVDGSELSHEAAVAGIEWARQTGAQVTVLFVGSVFSVPVAYAEAVPLLYPSKREYENAVRTEARNFLDRVAEAAAVANVTCTEHVVFAAAPAPAIVAAAKRHRCDLIVMGSHGRSGVGQLLLGSVTSKVLATCHIPVLVHRARRQRTGRVLRSHARSTRTPVAA